MKVMSAVFLLLFTYLIQDPGAVRSVPLDQEFQIKFGEQVLIEGTKFRLTFVNVANDSRCPRDVVCAWAGNAEVKLDLKKKPKQNTTSVVLNTTMNPRDTEFRGFTIRLVTLKPDRVSTTTINPADYEATLVVSRAKE